jgi:D-beta-D-heptose 7-phosphate kinase/D-beta-D-heptose 1-phosphate adenosyltransferase
VGDVNKKYLDDPNFRRIMNSLMNVELTTVAVSGYFDPLHVGHIDMLEMAKGYGDRLVVIVNSDFQAALKKGKSFMEEKDRLRIVASLKCVDSAFISIDKDRSVCKSLRMCAPHIFANGGDRTEGEIPESKICRELNIEMIDGLGKKIRSSSDYTGLK